jgi:nondiscriminating glutamyl-tRNA synthetase
LILNADRTKMSKRSGEAAVAVGDWRRAGYVPEALLSYLALLGFHPGDEREVLSRAELLQAFTLERVGRSGSVFDPDKLRWVNAHVLHLASGPELRAWAEPFLPGAVRGWPPARLEALLEAVRGGLTTLADLASELAPFLDEHPELAPEARVVLETDAARALCDALAGEWETLAEWRSETVKSALRVLGQRLGLKGRDLYQPVRAALTGRTHGPELPLVAELLGRERTVARLKAAAAMTRRSSL